MSTGHARNAACGVPCFFSLREAKHMTTQALLDTYYDGLAKRTGWEQTIADNFAFTGGSSNNSSVGKAAYLEAIHRFSRVVETVAVKESIVQGDAACVIVTYGLVSTSGKRTVMDIAEVW